MITYFIATVTDFVLLLKLLENSLDLSCALKGALKILKFMHFRGNFLLLINSWRKGFQQ